MDIDDDGEREIFVGPVLAGMKFLKGFVSSSAPTVKEKFLLVPILVILWYLLAPML
jgi:hypothetical protein